MSASIFFKKSLLTLLTSTALLSASSAFSATLSVGDIAPSFSATVNSGETIDFYQWIEQQGGVYTILFSHPRDFTPVCVTELAKAQTLQQQWKAKGVNIIGLSPSTASDHQQWAEDIAKLAHTNGISFPIIDDSSSVVAKAFGMLAADAKADAAGSAKDNYTVRSVFIINNETKAIEAMVAYPMFIGRNFDEIDRVVTALMTVAEHKHRVAMPANWKAGESVVVDPSLSDADAQQYYGEVKLTKLPSTNTGHADYLRFVSLEGQGSKAKDSTATLSVL